jgi:hypothetical protein
MNYYQRQMALPKKTNPERADGYESISEQNKERRQIQFSPESKESFETDYYTIEDEPAELNSREKLEGVLPIVQLTRKEERGLGNAFHDLFCCGGCSPHA